MSELWKPIPGYAGYEASTLGNIRYVLRWKSPRVLKPSPHSRGYWKYGVSLSGKTVTRMGHRLVALAWVENPCGMPEINHIDGVKTNNAPTNLEWTNHAENAAHARKIGLYQVGDGHHNVRRSDAEVIGMHMAKMNGESTASIARRMGMSRSAAQSILKGKARKPIFELLAASQGRKGE